MQIEKSDQSCESPSHLAIFGTCIFLQDFPSLDFQGRAHRVKTALITGLVFRRSLYVLRQEWHCVSVNELRQFRGDANVTQRELADLPKIPVNTFRMWDSGLRLPPTRMVGTAGSGQDVSFENSPSFDLIGRDLKAHMGHKVEVIGITSDTKLNKSDSFRSAIGSSTQESDVDGEFGEDDCREVPVMCAAYRIRQPNGSSSVGSGLFFGRAAAEHTVTGGCHGSATRTVGD
jgi:hypothetical protein